MNRLPPERRVQILALLCEGTSIGATSRIAGASFNTVDKMLKAAGTTCEALLDKVVRGVLAKRLQSKRIWSFRGNRADPLETAANELDGWGDVWTWVAVDADSGLVISWLVGGGDAEYGKKLMADVGVRIANGRCPSSSGYGLSLSEGKSALGTDERFGSLIKQRDVALGRRIDNHRYALALYFAWHNFIRIDKSRGVTPAMAAGVRDRAWTISEVLAMIDATTLNVRSHRSQQEDRPN